MVGGPPVPPPPPPPLRRVPPGSCHPATTTNAETEQTCCYERAPVDEEKIREDLVKFVHYRRTQGSTDGFEKNQLCTVYSHLNPILQRGPVCGIVALSMVGSLASPPVDPDYVLAKAISRGFTKKGEIFSAQTMLRLAQIIYPEHSAEIMEISIDSAERLCSAVIRGGIIILPYDADFNHAPALRNGHAAHWAVINGVAAFTENDGLDSELATAVSMTAPRKETAVSEKVMKLSNNAYLIGHQGKSAHTGIWDVQSCIQSNMNLKEISPKLVEAKESMVLHNMVTELQGKAILINPPTAGFK